ncbi:phage tail assembly protein [Corynebacterium coyleae]|uniref:phage tail assembly protein n=1 Tax=Corynebacterium coyleae TaxID=53374 RepID=UPI001CCA430F|nr:phage tail assembly protein [Corynebacterium coyleae]UBI10052.1 phage tail assembly protein [Corynebacterium coyleae]
MATFTLDSLREVVDKKYAPTVIEDGDTRYELPNILRLEKKKRDKIFDLIASIEGAIEDGDGEDFDAQLSIFSEIIETAEKNGNGKALVNNLDDPAMLLEVATSWMEASELGEAEL